LPEEVITLSFDYIKILKRVIKINISILTLNGTSITELFRSLTSKHLSLITVCSNPAKDFGINGSNKVPACACNYA
jgi:hypothetical protein